MFVLHQELLQLVQLTPPQHTQMQLHTVLHTVCGQKGLSARCAILLLSA